MRYAMYIILVLFLSFANILSFTHASSLIIPQNIVLDSGQSYTYNAIPSQIGGSYQWVSNGLNTISCTSNYCTITSPDVLAYSQYTLNVIYSVGNSITYNQSEIGIYPKMQLSNITPNNTEIDLGQSIVLGSNVSGGSGKYLYQWVNYNENSDNIINIDSNSISATPSLTGINNYALTAIDLGVSKGAFPSASYTTKNVLLHVNEPLSTAQIITNTINIYSNSIYAIQISIYGTPPYNIIYSAPQILNMSCNGAIILSCMFDAPNISGPIKQYNISGVITDNSIGTPKQEYTFNSVVNVYGTLGVPKEKSISVDSKQQFNINITPSFGVGPYTYNWNLGELSNDALNCVESRPNCTINAPDVNAQSTYNVILNISGERNIEQVLPIGNFISNISTISISVNPYPSLVVYPMQQQADLGERVDYFANVYNGVYPYIVNIYNLSGQIQASGIVKNDSGVYIPAIARAGPVSLYTANAIDLGDTYPFGFGFDFGTMTINSPLEFGTTPIINYTSDLNIGQNVVMTANVYGGVLPYRFNWSYNNVKFNGDSNSINFIANSTNIGTDEVNVTVLDAVNGTAYESFYIQVRSPAAQAPKNSNPTGVSTGGYVSQSYTTTTIEQKPSIISYTAYLFKNATSNGYILYNISNATNANVIMENKTIDLKSIVLSENSISFNLENKTYIAQKNSALNIEPNNLSNAYAMYLGENIIYNISYGTLYLYLQNMPSTSNSSKNAITTTILPTTTIIQIINSSVNTASSKASVVPPSSLINPYSYIIAAIVAIAVLGYAAFKFILRGKKTSSGTKNKTKARGRRDG